MRTVKWLSPLKPEMDNALLLFSSCDTNYLKYAVSLIKSVDKYSPGYNFVLHVINPDDTVEERIRQLTDSLLSTRLAVSFEYIDLSSLNEQQKLAYYASARFPQLAELLSHRQHPIFSLDADSLIVNPIDLNFSDKSDAEIILVRRDLNGEAQEHLAIATGSIWLKASEVVCQFMQQVANNIDEEVKQGTIKWFVDQIVFYRQIQAMSKDVKLYNLKRKYADWEFNESSIVWAGKGQRKDNDMRFFMLQILLSDEPNAIRFSGELKAFLAVSGNDLSHSQWMTARLEGAFDINDYQTRTEKLTEITQPNSQSVHLFLPRLDLPWKRGHSVHNEVPLLSDDVLELRLYWKKFAIRLANVIEKAGIPVKIIELPAWEINRKTVEASGAKLALIPHRCYLDFHDGPTPVLFFMQEYFRSVFVLDPKGWSAASSQYPFNLEMMDDVTSQSFDIYQKRLKSGELGSKFAQTSHKGLNKLLSQGDIPSSRTWFRSRKKQAYIFFPLQIPHDQSIRYFSDIAELPVVEALVKWAKANNIAVVLKPHPANRKAMKQFEKFVDGQIVFWSDAHVYELIRHSTAVYTINSGVGFEALLQSKPVVTFGRAEYDCVTFQATTDRLDKAWDYCCKADVTELETQYRQFINWFLGNYAVDLSQPELAMKRLETIAENIVSYAKRDVSHVSIL